VIVTQGRVGALLAEGSAREPFPSYPAPAEVDTTGAGALSVAAAGAREGMPTREAILDLLEQTG
jgi:sugar/nucleoside kinase (ribokinase family)